MQTNLSIGMPSTSKDIPTNSYSENLHDNLGIVES